MKQFKPSELPVNTLIDDYDQGTWLKDSDNTWFDVGNCLGLVFQEGPTEQERALFANHKIVLEPADEYFKNFKILSVPLAALEHMANEYSITIETDIREFAVEESIKRVAKGWGDFTPEEDRARQEEEIIRISKKDKGQ